LRYRLDRIYNLVIIALRKLRGWYVTAYTVWGNGRRYDEYGLAPTGNSMEAPGRRERDAAPTEPPQPPQRTFSDGMLTPEPRKR
jgi:hypothetical protein